MTSVVDASPDENETLSIQGIILLDVWQLPDLYSFYDNLVDHLRHLDIRCCINASYNLDITAVANDGSQPNDVSWRNTVTQHLWNRSAEQEFLDLGTMHPSDRLVFNSLRMSRSTYRCDPKLYTPDLLASDASVVILDPDDFLYHCDIYHNDSIHNWLVAGQSWNMCLHHRPMGLYNLSKIRQRRPHWNFVVTPWSVIDQHHQYLSDSEYDGRDGLQWRRIEELGHCLV